MHQSTPKGGPNWDIINGHRQLSVLDRELTKPIFSYFDGKLSSIASILINGLSYCLVKLHTSLSSIATLFYLE